MAAEVVLQAATAVRAVTVVEAEAVVVHHPIVVETLHQVAAVLAVQAAQVVAVLGVRVAQVEVEDKLLINNSISKSYLHNHKKQILQ
ncbi:MAG: hypothetical protein GZ091_13600 [Paludibacter sp.]|nr:hypothetical protein [Paludibacter sp.]